MDQHLPGAGELPGADRPLVLVAGADPQGSLRSAMAAGWSGPTVLVSTWQQAADLADGRDVGAEEADGAPRDVLALDQVGRCARFAGVEVMLTPLEAALLASLLRRPDTVVAYATLNVEVWGSAYRAGTAPVAPVLGRLRVKLRMLGHPGEILTTRGKGVRLVLAPGVRPLMATVS